VVCPCVLLAKEKNQRAKARKKLDKKEKKKYSKK